MDVEYDSVPRRSPITTAHLWWTGLILFCLFSAVSTLFIPPIFMMGLAACVVSVIVVLKYPFVGVMVYLVIFMVRPAEMYPALAPLRIERLVGILVLVAAMIRHKREHGKLFFPQDTTSRALFAFVGAMLLSWTVSYDRPRSQFEIEEFLKLIVFYVIIMYEVNTKKRFNIFIIGFVLLVGWIAFLSFRDYYGGGYIVRMGIKRAIGRTSAGGDANTLAGTLATTVPLVVAVFRVYKNAIIRLGCVALLGLLMIMIVNTGSRSGLLTLIVVGSAMIYFSRYRLISAVIGIVIIVGGWMVLPAEYKARYETLVDDDRSADQISSGRIEIWENGLRMIAAKPILGVGGNAFLPANATGEFGPAMAMQPHNLYIQLLAEYGIVGTVIWFTFLISLIHKLLRRRDNADEDDDEEDSEVVKEVMADDNWFDVMRRAMFATICGLMMSGMFGHSLMRYTWYVIAAMAVALVAVYYKSTPDASRLAELAERAEEDEEEAVKSVGI